MESFLRSEAEIILNCVGGNFPHFLIERNRIPSYPRISGDEVLSYLNHLSIDNNISDYI
jgi:hypothetical protein